MTIMEGKNPIEKGTSNWKSTLMVEYKMPDYFKGLVPFCRLIALMAV